MAAIAYGFQADQYEKQPMVENLDRAANISEWIEPYLAPTPNITQFRQFKLEKIEGKVCVSVRSRCSEEEEYNPWQSMTMKPGQAHTPVSLLRFAYHLLSCRQIVFIVGIQRKCSSGGLGQCARSPTTHASQQREGDS